MTHKLIKTGNYLLVVDDSKIKEGDWILNTVESIVLNFDKETRKAIPLQGIKKIIAHLPLKNSPILEGVPLLPPLEVVKYDFAEMFYNICKATYPEFDEWVEAKEYNKSKAKEKYKYTQEDILIIRNKLVSMLPTGDISAWDMIMAASNYTKWFDNYIQHLQQPKMPVGFECEDEVYMYSINGDTMKPKTTTNSQGHSVLVGTYKYE